MHGTNSFIPLFKTINVGFICSMCDCVHCDVKLRRTDLMLVKQSVLLSLTSRYRMNSQLFKSNYFSNLPQSLESDAAEFEVSKRSRDLGFHPVDEPSSLRGVL